MTDRQLIDRAKGSPWFSPLNAKECTAQIDAHGALTDQQRAFVTFHAHQASSPFLLAHRCPFGEGAA